MSRAGDKLVWLCRHVFCYNSGVNFPDWIVQEMNAREWSQSDLARQSGLTRQAISHLIAGRTKTPDKQTIEKLSRAFDVTVEDVYRYVGILPASQNDDPWVVEMSHKLSQLSPDLRGIAESVIGALRKNEKGTRKRTD